MAGLEGCVAQLVADTVLNPSHGWGHLLSPPVFSRGCSGSGAKAGAFNRSEETSHLVETNRAQCDEHAKRHGERDAAQTPPARKHNTEPHAAESTEDIAKHERLDALD